jgi:hypothetical protein
MKPLPMLATAVLALALAVPASASTITSYRGIPAIAHSGNFVASDDDQVCYEMSRLGYIGEVTSEMYGVKVDPPVDFDNGYVKTHIHGGGRYLDWQSHNVTVLAFIIKGGPNYHVYDYEGSGFDWDKKLQSPPHSRGNIPQISHYNMCYAKQPPVDEQGCTPGYWRNHADRWYGVAPGDDFDTTFGVDLFTPDVTLGWAIWAGGGGVNALARHATAALLNAWGGVPNADGATVAYPYTVAEVIQMVQDAVADDTIEATKDVLAAANELGCPLGGTSAVPVQ